MRHSLHVPSLGWPLFAAIFMGHKNGNSKGNPGDGTCNECWMKQTLKAAFTRDLLEPFRMELIGTAWNWSHCSAFTQDRFQKVPRALLNHKYFSRQRRRRLFCFSKQGRKFFKFHRLRRLLFISMRKQ